MTDLNLTGIRSESVEIVRGFTQDALNAFKEHLVSVNLAGSVLTKDYLPGRSDTNFVLLFQRFYPDFFDELAELGRIYGPRGVSAPLCMTQAYMETSLDAFPVEFYNLKLIHHTVSGRDLLADIKIEKADLRLQCERELKSHFLRLRNGFIQAGNDPEALRDMLLAAQSAYVPVLRALLHILGKEPPREAVPTITAIEEALGMQLAAMKDVARIKVEEARLDVDGLRHLFLGLYELGGALGEKVDQMRLA